MTASHIGFAMLALAFAYAVGLVFWSMWQDDRRDALICVGILVYMLVAFLLVGSK